MPEFFRRLFNMPRSVAVTAENVENLEKMGIKAAVAGDKLKVDLSENGQVTEIKGIDAKTVAKGGRVELDLNLRSHQGYAINVDGNSNPPVVISHEASRQG